MMSLSAPELGLAVVVLLLALHAICTHGSWFAMIWIGLTAAFGVGRELLLVVWRPLYAVQLGGQPGVEPGAAISTDALPISVGAGWCVAIYLGALFAKGFVERSRFRGRIAPFVLAHGLFTAMVALPVEVIAVPAGWWSWQIEEMCRIFEAPCFALLGWGIGGALFGLSYRLASRRTSHDPTKFGLLLVALPCLVVAQVGVVVLLAPWLAGAD